MLMVLELTGDRDGAPGRLSSLILFMTWFFLAYNTWNGWDYDSTDDIKNKDRSGLRIYTDHATGVQYVGNGWFGGITPRVDRNGEPYVEDMK